METGRDETAYALVSRVWPNRFGTHKEFKVWLDKQPESAIRRRKPSEYRMQIHTGDWHRYWADQDAKEFERLDDASAEQIADIEANKATARAKKQRAK